MKKITLFVAAILVFFGAAAIVGLSTNTVSAVGSADVCQGLDSAFGGAGTCDTPPGGKTVEGTVATLIRIFSWIVGVASVIMIMVGGFQYVTSGGDSGKVTTAKNTIMYSLIGIVIVVLAQVIVNFVLKKV